MATKAELETWVLCSWNGCVERAPAEHGICRQHRDKGFGYGVCIDCDRFTALQLPAVYPHICSYCLFPPAKREEPRLPKLLPKRTLSLVELMNPVRGSYYLGERRMDG